jgi:hypothetical protein
VPNNSLETRWLADTREIRARLLARTGKIVRRLDCRRRDSNGCQRARKQQTYKQFGVLAVGLDTITGRARRLARSDDVDVEASGLANAVKRIPSRPCFVASMDRLQQLREPGNHLPAADTEAGTRQHAALTIDSRGMR